MYFPPLFVETLGFSHKGLTYSNEQMNLILLDYRFVPMDFADWTKKVLTILTKPDAQSEIWGRMALGDFEGIADPFTSEEENFSLQLRTGLFSALPGV